MLGVVVDMEGARELGNDDVAAGASKTEPKRVGKKTRRGKARQDGTTWTRLPKMKLRMQFACVLAPVCFASIGSVAIPYSSYWNCTY
jgi:hypothetical protein